jgi:trimeric autotransporter adhesin
MTTRARTILTMLLAAIAALTGCGGDDDDPAPFDPEITEIAIRPGTPTVAVGRRIQLVAEAKTADGLSYDQNSVVEWQVSDAALLTVNEVGITQGVAAGDVIVTAIHPDGPTGEVTVHVIASDVLRVEVGPAGQTVEQDDTLQLTATAFLQDETSEDVTDRASWACNNLAAARVNDAEEKGLLTGVAPGQATVAATFLGVRGGAPIVVTAATEEE